MPGMLWCSATQQTCVAQALDLAGESQRRGQRIGGCVATTHRCQIEDGENGGCGRRHVGSQPPSTPECSHAGTGGCSSASLLHSVVPRGDSVGNGVIGNTAVSGTVIQGSSPCSPAQTAYRGRPPCRPLVVFGAAFGWTVWCRLVVCWGYLAPSSSGLGHHPLKVAARVRIPLGLLGPTVGSLAPRPADRPPPPGTQTLRALVRSHRPVLQDLREPMNDPRLR